MVVFVIVTITVYFCYLKIEFDLRYWSLRYASLLRCSVEALWPKKRFFCNPSISENLLLVFLFWRTNFTDSTYQSTFSLGESWGAVKKVGTKLNFRVDCALSNLQNLFFSAKYFSLFIRNFYKILKEVWWLLSCMNIGLLFSKRSTSKKNWQQCRGNVWWIVWKTSTK